MTDPVVNPETPAAPSWYIDDGIPGVGERPAWLGDKFKSVSDLAKSYSELEKKFGSAPEDYDFSKSRYLDPDYVPFQELKQIAKEKRVPQEVMDKMLESVDKYMDEFKTDPEEEIKKLGGDAGERLVTLDNWAKVNLSEDSYKALKTTLTTAESIKALEELRGRMMSTTPQIPTGNTGTIAGSATIEDLRAELSTNLQKYKTDKAYQKDISDRLAIAVKNTPGFVDKVGA
jgi:hypothetical protein